MLLIIGLHGVVLNYLNIGTVYLCLYLAYASMLDEDNYSYFILVL
jgi:hypothetical protein